jgi:beta-lactam-binding protein with PASTA domain
MQRFTSLLVFTITVALATPALAALARMPDLRQHSILEAKAYLDQHDLSVLWTGAGEFIADQSPKPGKKIPDDGIVTLTLRDPGPADPRVRFYDFKKLEPVPTVTNLPLGLARARLEAAGFRVQVVPPTRLAPEPRDINHVYEQEPAAGARVPRPAAVKISAYRPGFFRAPTVIGMTV